MPTIDWFPLLLSLRVATVATLLSLVVGLLVAWVLARREFRGKSLLDALTTLPLVMPPTVLGYYLLVALGQQSPVGRFFAGLGWPLVFTWRGATLAASVASFPLLVQAARAGFESVDPRLEDMARTLGRSEFSIFWSVTLPLAWRSILAGTVLAFARALGEFGVTLMVAGNIPHRTQTMAIAIYDMVQAGRQAEANVMVVLMTVVAVVLVIVARRAAQLVVE
ncbi:MAG: molybdate ABC transporter permease subunit [Anaerolineae bacterium]